MAGGPEIVFCADDFTGASDSLATLARGGRNVRLYLDVPTLERNPEIAELDAFGVATSLRAMAAGAASVAMEMIVEGFAPLNGQFHYLKVCSTFDSGPKIGNIALSARAYGRGIGAEWTAIIGGQPSLGRYCVFGNLFAKASDGTVYRIDRHPVMMHHPVTPMGEADLRKHLQRQGMGDIGLVTLADYSGGIEQLISVLEARLADGETHTLFDVSCAEDLALIGGLLRRMRIGRQVLCVGASSVAQALIAAGSLGGDVRASSDAQQLGRKPVLAIAGSRSQVTKNQVMHCKKYKRIALDPAIVSGGANGLNGFAQTCAGKLSTGENVLVHLLPDADYAMKSQALAEVMAGLVHDICLSGNVGCLAIAGGDTSSLAMQNLDIESLSFVADFDHGVPVIKAHGGALDGLPMLLKGGQMGALEFFDNIVEMHSSFGSLRRTI